MGYLSLTPLAKNAIKKSSSPAPLPPPLENIFNTTREKMFEMVKRNEAVFALGLKSNIWNIMPLQTYKEWLDAKKTREDFPIALVF